MFGSNDETPLPAIAAGQAALLSGGTEIIPTCWYCQHL